MNEYIPPTLKQPINDQDHIWGPTEAKVTITEYGDYQCPHCGHLHQILRQLIDESSSTIRFVFRHFPVPSIHRDAQLAAEAAEAAGAQGKFWEMHMLLFERQSDLSYDALLKYAEELELDLEKFKSDLDNHVHLEKIQGDFKSGIRSGVNGTPTIFINGSRYDGAWDIRSMRDIIQKPFGVKIQKLTQSFTQLAVSGGILLFAFTIIALIWANSPFSDEYFHIWEEEFILVISGFHLEEHIIGIINDGLMALFFLVVGLEIKREIMIGELSNFRKATLPIFAALGGMVVPALLYVIFNPPGSEGFVGWGIPMATDIAFLLVILTFLDSRIPPSLRVFFSALVIVDDLGAILIISIFYTEQLEVVYLVYGFIIIGILLILNRLQIHVMLLYSVLGLMLWYFFLESGVHATIAGVLFAFTLPAHHPANTEALIAQCTTLQTEYELAPKDDESRREAVVQTLETISDRLLSPAQRFEHEIQPWTTYMILPLFALSNAGVSLSGVNVGVLADPISLGILLGLVIGKPLGILLFSYAGIKMGIAELPSQVDWKMLFCVSWLAGIGFTMSLFISGIAFSGSTVLGTAKVGILLASMLATLIGVLLSILILPKIGRENSAYIQKLL